MIARTWTGRTRRSDADVCLDYVVATGLADFRKTEGNQGVWIWRRDDGDVTEFRVVSLWDSMAAIEKEVGADTARARYYPEPLRVPAVVTRASEPAAPPREHLRPSRS